MALPFGFRARPVVIAPCVLTSDYQLQATGGTGPTDARVLQSTCGGVVTGLLSVPLRSCTRPSAVLCLGDVQATINLTCAYCRRLKPDPDFTPW